MRNLQLIIFTVMYGLGASSFAQGQSLSKLMFWNGKNLELVYAKTGANNMEIKALYYQRNVFAKKIKLQLKKTNRYDKWMATNPQTGQRFEVWSTMTILFTYPNGRKKEFLYMAEYRNGQEKIMMGSLPFLGDIIYQKNNQAPELWLAEARNHCKLEQEKRVCNFTTSKGKNLRLIIKLKTNYINLWRDGKMLVFKPQN